MDYDLSFNRIFICFFQYEKTPDPMIQKAIG